MSEKNKLSESLNWYGWDEGEGSRVDYFNEQDISCSCRGPCKDCGYHYLDIDGGILETDENGNFTENAKTKKPLCGVW